MTSSSRMTRSSSPSTLTVWPAYLPKRTFTGFQLERAKRSILQQPATADRDDFTLLGLFRGRIGNHDAEAVVRCVSIRLTITRS